MSVLHRYKPIGIWREEIILFKRGVIYRLDNNSRKIIKYGDLTKSLKEIFLSTNSYLNRLLRLGVRTSYISKSGILFAYIGSTLFEYNMLNKTLDNVTYFNNRSLYITEVNNIEGFQDCIVFGEYFNNPEKKEVKIFSKSVDTEWKTTYAFLEGEINHIHNIIPDKYEKCLWILTGDFGNSSAIWKVEENFKKVECVLRGKQIFRSCIGFPTREGLIYATDTPFSKNSVRLLYKNNADDNYYSKHIQDINGSCIYGCRYNDKLYFSTVVESNGVYKNRFHALLSRCKGDGIKDYKSYLYKEDGRKFKIVYSSEKDALPFVPFQFGSIQFPAVDFHFDVLPLYHVASKKYDLSTLLLKI